MKGTIWLVESHLKFVMRRLMNYSWVRMFTSDLTHGWWRESNVSESTVGYRRWLILYLDKTWWLWFSYLVNFPFLNRDNSCLPYFQLTGQFSVAVVIVGLSVKLFNKAFHKQTLQRLEILQFHYQWVNQCVISVSSDYRYASIWT